MRFQNFKKRISENKKAVILVSTSGFSACVFLLFAPYFAISLVLGIICFGVAYDYRKNKAKGRKRTIVLSLLLIIGTVYLASFIAITTQTRESMTVEEGTMEYSQEGYLYGGEFWNFDTDVRDKHGQMKPQGEARFPNKPGTAIYHEFSSSQRASNDNYTFQIKTNIEFKNLEIKVSVRGSSEPYLEGATKITEFTITIYEAGEEEPWNFESWDNITTDGDDNYRYYLFVISGEVEEDQEVNTRYVWTWISIESDEEGGEWGFTEIKQESLSEMMTSMFDPASPLFILVIMMMSIIMLFTIAFLLFIGTDGMEHMDKVLIIMTMAGLLLLLYLIAWSEHLPVIREILFILESLPYFFGIWEALIVLVRLIGMVVAFFLWSWTVGSAISICWLMYYVWNKFMGGFLDDVVD